MSVQIVDGKVHDADGRLLWIDGITGIGRPMTTRDLAVGQFRGLQDTLDHHGYRAAMDAAAENEPELLWTVETRARLARRLAVLDALPAEVGELSADDPRRWAADKARMLLGLNLVWRDGGNLHTMPPGRLERVRDRVLARIELLYDVVDALLDWSGAPLACPFDDDPPSEPSATMPAEPAEPARPQPDGTMT